MSDSNTEIDYGPLQQLIGRWEGEKGTDLSPEPDGEESTPYYETLDFVETGTVTNAGQQTLAVLRYHQVVKRLSDDVVFHDETGYWMKLATGCGMQPRRLLCTPCSYPAPWAFSLAALSPQIQRWQKP